MKVRKIRISPNGSDEKNIHHFAGHPKNYIYPKYIEALPSVIVTTPRAHKLNKETFLQHIELRTITNFIN